MNLSQIIFSLIFILIAPSSVAQKMATFIPTFEDTTPLAGKIWDVKKRHFITDNELQIKIEESDWILLGENHENEVHHQIEQQLISYLGDRELLGNVALEMANHEQQELLDRSLGNRTVAPQTLNWSQGWPWDWYKDVVLTSLTQADRVIATDLTRAEQLDAYNNKNIELPSDNFRRFMDDLLFESHCGKLPKSQLGNMLRVQIARDMAMGKSIAANTTDKVDLYLAGTMHTRYDTGIPRYTSLDSITILLVSAGEISDPSLYIPETYSGEAIADYIIFTPEVEPTDHCADL